MAIRRNHYKTAPISRRHYKKKRSFVSNLITFLLAFGIIGGCIYGLLGGDSTTKAINASSYRPTVTITATIQPTATATVKPTATLATKPTATEEEVIYVYVSSSGKYHSYDSCSHMKSSTKMTLEQAQEAGYTACKKCW